LRMRIHNVKPEVIIVTETRIEDRDYDGKGVFRGYKSVQHSSTGRRAGGVMVFVKRDFKFIEGTARNSRDGHYTIAAYEYKGDKYIIGGIYGNCTNVDGLSAEIFSKYTDWHRELRLRMGYAHSIVGGDFNLKLDIGNNFKPRTTAILTH
jgi:exonuclease III